MRGWVLLHKATMQRVQMEQWASGMIHSQFRLTGLKSSTCTCCGSKVRPIKEPPQMPTLEFKGKPFVYSHHLSVPFRELIVDPKKVSRRRARSPHLTIT